MGSYTGPTLASLELCCIKSVEAEQAHAAGIYSPIARKGVKPYGFTPVGSGARETYTIEREIYIARNVRVTSIKPYKAY